MNQIQLSIFWHRIQQIPTALAYLLLLLGYLAGLERNAYQATQPMMHRRVAEQHGRRTALFRWTNGHLRRIGLMISQYGVHIRVPRHLPRAIRLQLGYRRMVS